MNEGTIGKEMRRIVPPFHVLTLSGPLEANVKCWPALRKLEKLTISERRNVETSARFHPAVIEAKSFGQAFDSICLCHHPEVAVVSFWGSPTYI